MKSHNSPTESQYELLRLPDSTSPPNERLDPYDSYSDVSRSLSPARSDRQAGIHPEPVEENAYSHNISSQRPLRQWSTRNLYLPLALKRITFILLSTSFVVLAGVLGLLFGLSASQHGISAVESRLYYVWTYGPTAVFTILSVFWNQVEWRMMQWTSWMLMYRHTRSANDSILLDYHSYWNVYAMLLATKRGHFRVTLVVLGNLLISALTVISAGLFTGQYSSVAYDATMQMSSRVNPPGNLNLTAVDKLPYIRAFLTMHQNMTASLGTHENSVYETFFDRTVSNNITAAFTQNTTYMANVTALTFNLDCENATVINNPRANFSEVTPTLAMESSSCTNTSTNFLFAYASQGGAYQLSATMGCCNCGADDGLRAQANFYGIQADNGQDWRLFTFSSRFKETPSSRILLTTDNADIVGFICKPQITGNRALVSLAQDSGTNDVRSNLTINGDWDLAGFNKSSAVQLLLGAYKSYYVFTGGPASSSFFLNPGDDGYLDKFFDAEYLQDRAKTSIPNIMAQIANSYFMSTAQSSINGHILTMQFRLGIRNIAFTLMMAGLVLLGLISGALLLIGQKACVSHDPSSIAATAAILSKSFGLKQVLHDTGPLSSEPLSDFLSTTNIRSQIDELQRFSIIVSGDSSRLDPFERQLRWWRPASSLLWFRFLTLAAPIVLIALFETGVQISIRNGGIATISLDGGWHYFWLYWPPLFIFVTRVFLNIIDFNTKIYQPFHMLSKGRVSASSSLFEFLQGKIAIIALAISIRKRYWAVMASTIAVIVSPFLSIIVASLWSIVPATTIHNVSLRQLDRWNFSDPSGSLYYSPLWYSGIDSRDTGTGITTYLGQDGVIPSMILNYNTSYPMWTTSEFVLPTLGVEATGSEDLSNIGANTTISAMVPAMRGNLNCQILTSASISWWSRPQTNTGNSNGILTNVSYGVSGLGNRNDNCGYPTNLTINIGLSFDKANPPFYGESVDTRISSLNLTTRSDCPTRLFFLSSLGSNPTTKALICRPRLEQVQANVTLNYPSLSFSTSHPPFIASDTESVVIYDGFFNTSHALPYSDASIGSILNTYVHTNANNSAGLGDVFPSVNEVDSALLGTFEGNTFNQISYTFGTSFEDMFNSPDLMKTRVEQIYSIIVGQVLRAYGREANVAPSGNDPGQAPISATLSTPNERERLVQNPIVTRILEGLLGLVLICMLATMFLQHTRHVVPKDPGSIGAVMSLLAGASDKFWSIFEKMEGSEWMSDKELEKSGIFDGIRFRMGWEGDSHPAVGAPVAESRMGLFRSDYRKVNADEVDFEGVRRRWCIDVDERQDGL